MSQLLFITLNHTYAFSNRSIFFYGLKRKNNYYPSITFSYFFFSMIFNCSLGFQADRGRQIF